MMNSNFKISADGILEEYRGEKKSFYVHQKGGDLVATITSYYKEHMERITIPDSVREVGFYAFKGCRSLKTIVFQEGLERLPLGALWGCENLENVYFCRSLKQVSPDAFPTNRKITVHVDYVAGLWGHLKRANWLLHRIPKDIFNQYAGILIGMKMAYQKIINLVLHLKSDVYSKEFDGFPVPDCQVVIEEDITTATRLFQCSLISKVTVGENVRYLNPDIFSGGNEFYKDTALEEILVEPQNKGLYYSIDGVLFHAKELIRYPQMKLRDNNSYEVPEGTTAIGDGAFSWAYGIEYIYLPPQVEVRRGSFANMPKLQAIYCERAEE